jgi:hypothetical protein
MTRTITRNSAAALCGLWITTMAAPLAQAQVRTNLGPETIVKVVAVDTVRSGSSRKGERVDLRVDEEIVDGAGNVLIRKGTPAYGTVTQSRRAGMFGRRGLLSLSIDYTTAVDGQRVPLRAAIDKAGKGKGWLAVGGAIVLAPIVGLVKGKNVSIQPGTVLLASVDGGLDVGVGSAGQVPAGQAVFASGGQTVLLLHSGDKITGRIESLIGGTYTVVTENGVLKIDAAKVRGTMEAGLVPKPVASNRRAITTSARRR